MFTLVHLLQYQYITVLLSFYDLHVGKPQVSTPQKKTHRRKNYMPHKSVNQASFISVSEDEDEYIVINSRPLSCASEVDMIEGSMDNDSPVKLVEKNDDTNVNCPVISLDQNVLRERDSAVKDTSVAVKDACSIRENTTEKVLAGMEKVGSLLDDRTRNQFIISSSEKMEARITIDAVSNTVIVQTVGQNPEQQGTRALMSESEVKGKPGGQQRPVNTVIQAHDCAAPNAITPESPEVGFALVGGGVAYASDLAQKRLDNDFEMMRECSSYSLGKRKFEDGLTNSCSVQVSGGSPSAKKVYGQCEIARDFTHAKKGNRRNISGMASRLTDIHYIRNPSFYTPTMEAPRSERYEPESPISREERILEKRIVEKDLNTPEKFAFVQKCLHDIQAKIHARENSIHTVKRKMNDVIDKLYRKAGEDRSVEDDLKKKLEVSASASDNSPVAAACSSARNVDEGPEITSYEVPLASSSSTVIDRWKNRLCGLQIHPSTIGSDNDIIMQIMGHQGNILHVKWLVEEIDGQWYIVDLAETLPLQTPTFSKQLVLMGEESGEVRLVKKTIRMCLGPLEENMGRMVKIQQVRRIHCYLYLLKLIIIYLFIYLFQT